MDIVSTMELPRSVHCLLLMLLLVWHVDIGKAQLGEYGERHVFGGSFEIGPKTVDECQRRCRASAACLAVDFDRSGNTCWFHKDDTACKQLATKNSCTHYRFIACGSHIFGGTKQSNLLTITDCIRGCTGTCRGIDFDRADRTCWFHTAETECNAFSTRSSCIHWRRGTCLNLPQAAVPTPSPVSTTPSASVVSTHPGQHIFRGMKQREGTTQAACISSCMAIYPACQGVDFDSRDNSCWFHTASTVCNQLSANSFCMHIKLVTCGATAVASPAVAPVITPAAAPPPSLTDSRHPCGVPERSPNIQARIVGGEEVIEHSWPWHVGMYIKTRNTFPNCGASLLNSEWLISAAHCYSGQSQPSAWEARIGDHHTRLMEASEIRRTIAQIFRHPQFEAATFDYDIALLKLSSPIILSAERAPVCLPDARVSFADNMQCAVTGWGVITPGSSQQPMKLHQAQVPLVNQGLCNASYSGQITDRMICAGDTTMDACQGDSGGPMVCSKNGVWYQMGIISFGIGCAQPNRPGVNTRVKYFTNWIHSIINSN